MPERRKSAATLKAMIATRAANWARRRHGDDHLPLTVSSRRVMILPTRGGLAFAVLLVVMLLAGINYSNSMAMMLTFLLGAFGLISMHLTHRNLVGLTLRGIQAGNGFAEDRARMQFTLTNDADTARFGIRFAIDRDIVAEVDVPAASISGGELQVPLGKRGRLRIERLKLSTAFPFGLFRAWTWVHLPLEILVWPAPRGRQDPPTQAATGGNAPAVHRAGDEEWAGLREFRSGDSPRQVAWPLFARGRGLMVKTYESPAAHHYLFDLASVPGADPERRLEQLSAWVVAAHARGDAFGLRLGTVEIAPGGGNDQRARCLDSLAMFGS